MLDSTWMAFLSTLMWSVPQILIYVVGLVLALVFWRRHPVVSLLCASAFVLLLGSRVLAGGMQFWILQAHDRDVSGTQIGYVMGAHSLAQMLVHSLVWILILTAMFGWRNAPAMKKAF